MLFSICENVGLESFQDIFENSNPSHDLELDYLQFFGAKLYFPKPVGFPQFHLQILKAADESIRRILNKLSFNNKYIKIFLQTCTSKVILKILTSCLIRFSFSFLF